MYANTINFLDFTDKEKRISYAASFGVSKIPENFKEDYKKWLTGLKAISLREDAGKEIVESLTDQKAIVVLDPTMLLDSEEWSKLAKPAKSKPKGKYLLTYFLGDKSKEIINRIDYLSKTYDLEVVNLADKNDKETYETGPSEFIDFIKDSTIFY